MNYQLVRHLKMKWQIKDTPNYKWSECKKLINTKTGREIKKTIAGRSIGYWIGKEFITLNNMKNRLELIPKDKNPF